MRKNRENQMPPFMCIDSASFGPSALARSATLWTDSVTRSTTIIAATAGARSPKDPSVSGQTLTHKSCPWFYKICLTRSMHLKALDLQWLSTV